MRSTLINSPLTYFGNRKHSIENYFTIIDAYQEQRGRFNCYYDLFSGSASMSLYAIANNLADRYVINDLFAPLMHFWLHVKDSPNQLIDEYENLVKRYEACLQQSEQKPALISSNKEKKWKNKQPVLVSQTRIEFYQQLQEQFNLAATTKISHTYSAIFAFIINHAENGMPLLSETSTSPQLACKLTGKLGRLTIDNDFSRCVMQIHQLFKDKDITFTNRDFRDFDDEILETKSGNTLVVLDPPYPDMPDATQQPLQHVYQRSEPKSQLQQKINQLMQILSTKKISFMLFYGVLGMENHYPIYYPEGHVLHRVAANPPFPAYIEHLYLSPRLAPYIPQHQRNIQPLFHRIVETLAVLNGQKTALAWKESVHIKELTYAQLNQAANRLARYLLQQGLDEKLQHKSTGKEPLVALYLDRGPTLIISLLAIMKTGAAFLPIETNQNRLNLHAAYQRILQSQACMLLTDQAKLLKRMVSLDSKDKLTPILLDPQQDPFFAKLTSELKTEKFNENLDRLVEPFDLAYVIYTSGSTGVPKGVEILHRGLTYAFESHQDLLNIGCDDRVAQFASIGFDASIMEIMMALGTGAQLHLVSDQQYTDSIQLTQFLQQHRITIAIQTPKILAGLSPHNFPNLRALLIVGDSFGKELSDAWLTPIMVNGQKVCRQVINGYGLTETTICTTLDPCDKAKPLTIGKPILGLEVYLRSLKDEEKNLDWQLSDWSSLMTLQAERRKRAKKIAAHTLLPMHVISTVDEYLEEVLKGAIYVSGPCLARGYWQRLDLTQARFKEVKIADQRKRLYQTGDVGYYLADGNLVFTGRIDRQVKIRGQRVELGEIEAVLLKIPEPAISAVRVIAYTPPQDTKTSKSSEKCLVVYLEPQDKTLIITGGIPGEASLLALQKIRTYLREQMLSSMCPALNHMTFVASLPRKQNDKLSVDDGDLQKRQVPCIRIPVKLPELDLSVEAISLIEWLRRQWAYVLDMSVSDIPYADFTFTELGGDSISARRYITLLHQQAYEQVIWSSALCNIMVNDVLDSDIISLLKIIQHKQDECKKKQREYQQLDRDLPYDSAQRFFLDIDKIHEDKVYDKKFLSFFCVHSLLGDAQNDYRGTVLENLNWHFLPLSTPPIETFKKWQKYKKSESLIAQLVEYHLQKIIQKKGPYWILGWSTGGLITHLVASKLRQKGELVFTVLLDSHHPRLLQSMDRLEFAKNLSEIGEKIEDSMAKYLNLKAVNLPLPKLTTFAKKTKKNQVNLFFKAILKSCTQHLPLSDIEKTNAIHKMIQSAWMLLKEELAYPIKRLPILTHQDYLILAADSQQKSSLSNLGWEVKSSSSNVILLEGNHFDLLQKSELLNKLTQIILAQIKALKMPMYNAMSAMRKTRDSKVKVIKESLALSSDLKTHPLTYFHDRFIEMSGNCDDSKTIKWINTSVDAFNADMATASLKYSDPHKAEFYVYHGIVHHEKKSYDAAIADFTQAIVLDEKCIEAYYRRGMAYLKSANESMALKDFNQYIQSNDTRFIDHAYYNSAYIKLNLGDYERALLDINKSIDFHIHDLTKDHYENQSSRYLLRSWIHQALGLTNLALTDLDQAITLKSDMPLLYHHRALIKGYLQSKNEAIKDLNIAIKIYNKKCISIHSPDSDVFHIKAGAVDAITSYYARGLLHYELNQFHSAIKDFLQVITINPNYHHAYKSLALAQFELENYTAFKQNLLRYLQHHPEDVQAANILKKQELLFGAMQKAEQDDYKAAIIDYNLYLSKYPNDINGYVNRGLAKAHSDDFKGAIADYSVAIQLNSHTAPAYANRAIALLNLSVNHKNAYAALADLNRAISLGLHDDFVYHERGKAYSILGEYNLAIADYDRVIQINDQYVFTYGNRGSLFEQRDTFADGLRAREDYDKAIRLGNHSVHYSSGMLNLKLGYYEEARNSLKNITNNLTAYIFLQKAIQYHAAEQEEKLFDIHDGETVTLSLNQQVFDYINRLKMVIGDELILHDKQTVYLLKTWLKQLTMSAVNELAENLEQPILRPTVRKLHQLPCHFTLFKFTHAIELKQEVKTSIPRTAFETHRNQKNTRGSIVNKKSCGLVCAVIGFFAFGGLGGLVMGGMLGLASPSVVTAMRAKCKKREPEPSGPRLRYR